jgi:serine/threonine-protein kinase
VPILRPGLQPLPGYRLTELLGKGGFGEVWQAETAKGAVALKFLPCDHSASASEENRSIQMVRQLRHPNLLNIDNVWCYPGYLILAMELADGTMLDLFEAYHSKYSTNIIPEHLCLLLAQAATVLDFLNTRQHRIHDQVVALQHCDVKPNNLLLCGQTLKLTDFSLTSATTSVMKNHRQAGTPDYCAPEVFQGRLSDRTDQYALAVTYFLLRTGQFPFEPVPKPMSRTYVRPAPDLSPLPVAEQPIIARALAPVPLDRWPSCSELIEQLRKQIHKAPKALLADAPRSVEAGSTRKAEPTDRRQARRYTCSLQTSGRLLGKHDEPPWTATIRDISRGGVGLLSNKKFVRGTILVVKLLDRAERFDRPLLVRVVRAIPQAKGEWLLGCTFASKLNDDDLERLLQSATRSGS